MSTTNPNLASAPMMRGASGMMNLGDSVYERLLRERIIFLGSQVDDVIANQLAAQMLLLSAEDPKRDIHLYINSPGGSVTAGMAIYDTMQFIDCDVATYGMGLAASMGQFLLTAGTRGQALRPAARADHDAPAVGRRRRNGVGHRHPGGPVPADQERAQRAAVLHTGQPVEQIEKDSDRDRWFTAKEALEYGFVDHVVSKAAMTDNTNPVTDN